MWLSKKRSLVLSFLLGFRKAPGWIPEASDDVATGGGVLTRLLPWTPCAVTGRCWGWVTADWSWVALAGVCEGNSSPVITFFPSILRSPNLGWNAPWSGAWSRRRSCWEALFTLAHSLAWCLCQTGDDWENTPACHSPRTPRSLVICVSLGSLLQTRTTGLPLSKEQL